jgi:RNA polymerase sigma factor (sigma-70 family)
MPAAQLPGIIRHLGLAVAARGCDGVSDGELLQRFFGQRDKAAFELLVWRHGKMVLGTCRRLLRDVHEAEDAFQACFLTLVRRGGSIGRRESVGGWLHKVAYRVALGLNARRARRDVRERCLWARMSSVRPADPAYQAAWREVGQVLDEEVNRLPDIYRVPFVLCCLEGRTNADVAGELGCAIGTIESRLTRARRRLRAGLARRGVTLSAGMIAALAGSNAASAFVPTTLVACTARAAIQVAADGVVATSIVSAPVAAMTEGVVRAMFMTKLKAAAAIVMAVTLAGTGTGVLAFRPASTDQPVAPKRPPPRSRPTTSPN